MTNAQPIISDTLPPAIPGDVELSRGIANADGEAFEQLMRRHNRTLLRTARAILRNDAEAEDAMQDAYLRAYRSIGTFRGEAKLSTWLVRIVVNEARARRRVEELSVAETALALNLPEVTVRTRFFRARSHLRNALAGRVDLPFRAAFAFAGERCARVVARVLAAMLLAASLTGCGERPQLLIPEGEPAIEKRLERDGQLRERTLNQGESDRMSY